MKFINPIGVLSKPTSRSIEHARTAATGVSIDRSPETHPVGALPTWCKRSKMRPKKDAWQSQWNRLSMGFFLPRHSESFQNTKKSAGSSMDFFIFLPFWQKRATFGWFNHHCVVYQFVLFRRELNQGRKHRETFPQLRASPAARVAPRFPRRPWRWRLTRHVHSGILHPGT